MKVGRSVGNKNKNKKVFNQKKLSKTHLETEYVSSRHFILLVVLKHVIKPKQPIMKMNHNDL